MKVSVTITVELDPEEWTLTFGVEGDRAIRNDVKEYVTELARGGAFANGEVGATITGR